MRTAAKTAADDLRLSFGLVALKTSNGAGGWVNVVQPRPHTRTEPTASTVLAATAGAGLPEGEKLDIAADGTVTLTGGFRTVAGEWLRRGVHFRFRPEGGVRLIFPTEKGDRIKYFAGVLRLRRRPASDRGQPLGFRRAPAPDLRP